MNALPLLYALLIIGLFVVVFVLVDILLNGK